MNSEAVVLILLSIASWIVSGTITYGVMKTKITEFERRLTLVEIDHRQLQRDFTKHQIESAKGESQ